MGSIPTGINFQTFLFTFVAVCPVDCNFMHDKLKVSRLSNDISSFGCVGEHIERELAQ